MLHPLKNKLSWMAVFVALFVLQACTDTSTGGGPVTDPDPEPEPTGRKESTYSPDQNLIDPLKEDFFDFYTRQRPFPFNEKAVKAMEITAMQVRQYSDADNEGMTEESTENGLELSKSFDFTFDENGRLATFKRMAFIVGDPADSAHLAFSYFPSGKLDKIQVTSPDGDVEVKASYELDEIISYEDPGGFSTSYAYDDPNKLRYETTFNKAGATTVNVFGPEGAFSDEIALELQAEILQRQSEFVDYGNAISLKDIAFIEEQAGRPLSEIVMGPLEEIAGRTQYSYQGEVVSQRRFREEGENAEVEELRFHYNKFGDLIKSVYNEQNAGESGITAIHQFEYNDQGRWTKRIHSKKIGVGSTKVDRLDFVSYE